MTGDALTQLEAKLEVQLPQEYSDVLKDYPFSGGHFGSSMLMDDAEVLARRNRPAATKRVTKKFMPGLSNGFFWIGSDGGELSFYVKPGRKSRGVWYFDIESEKIHKYCDNIGDYLEKCRKIDAEEERLPNEASKLPLWMQNVYAFSLLAGFILFGYMVFRGARWLLHYFGLK